MPDLITHGCIGLLWKGRPQSQHVASFVAGNLLPDLLARVPSMGLNLLRDRGLPISDVALYIWGPFHMPVGMALSAYMLSFLTPEQGRGAVFRSLLGGMLLHLGTDMLQYHYGVGYLLFYPFWRRSFEFGVIGSEDSVYLAPLLVVLTGWVWWRRAKTIR